MESPRALIRLQRVLASAGLGSRRECEKLIVDGRVEVDGVTTKLLGAKVDPDHQTILVDGERIKLQRLKYFMLNKPPGVLSTNVDPAGRTRVVDLIKSDQRIYNVGRLDQSSEGLIIVTNDGDLAFRLTHPKFGVPKRYLVQVVGLPTPDQLRQLERGVYLAEGKAKAASVQMKKRTRTGAVLEMVLEEGRNREIRRVLARIGHKVTRLVRIAIGPVQLGDLPPGAHRKLTLDEIEQLRTAGSTHGSKKKIHPRGAARKPKHRDRRGTRNQAFSSRNSGDRVHRARKEFGDNRPSKTDTRSKAAGRSKPSRGPRRSNNKNHRRRG